MPQGIPLPSRVYTSGCTSPIPGYASQVNLSYPGYASQVNLSYPGLFPVPERFIPGFSPVPERFIPVSLLEGMTLCGGFNPGLRRVLASLGYSRFTVGRELNLPNSHCFSLFLEVSHSYIGITWAFRMGITAE